MSMEDKAGNSPFDEAIIATFPPIEQSRLLALRDDIQWRYGIEALVTGPRRITVFGDGALARLHDEVWRDKRLDAIGRGWMLGAGGEFTIVEMPAWTLDATAVAWRRLIAVLIMVFKIRKFASWLNGA